MKNYLALFITPKILSVHHVVSSNDYATKEDGREEPINLQAVGEGRVQLFRTPQEKDRLPDRISLDRYV